MDSARFATRKTDVKRFSRGVTARCQDKRGPVMIRGRGPDHSHIRGPMKRHFGVPEMCWPTVLQAALDDHFLASLHHVPCRQPDAIGRDCERRSHRGFGVSSAFPDETGLGKRHIIVRKLVSFRDGAAGRPVICRVDPDARAALTFKGLGETGLVLTFFRGGCCALPCQFAKQASAARQLQMQGDIGNDKNTDRQINQVFDPLKHPEGRLAADRRGIDDRDAQLEGHQCDGGTDLA